MTPRQILFVLLIAIVWGGNFVAIKVGLDDFSPLFFCFLRFFVILILLLPWLRIKPGQMKPLLWTAFTGGPVHFAAIFLGLAMIGGAASAAMLSQLSAPLALLLAVIFLGERIGIWRIMGMALAFAGVAVMSFDPRVFDHLDGVGVLILSQLAYASAAVLMRQLKGVSVFELQAWMGLVSAPVLLVVSLLTETGQWEQLRSMTWSGGGALAYTVLGASIFGHGGIYLLYQRHPVSVITPYLLITPLCGVLAAIVFLGEAVTERMILGGLIIFAGVAVVTVREQQRARRMGV